MKKQKEDMYFARFRQKDGVFQLLNEHLTNTSEICSFLTEKIGCKELGFVMGLFHDSGKYTNEWQQYLKKGSKLGVLQEKKDHATAGALLLERFFEKEKLSSEEIILELLQMCILCHHGSGLPDMLAPDGNPKFRKRLLNGSNKKILDEIENNFDSEININAINFKNLCCNGMDIAKSFFAVGNENDKRRGSFNVGILSRILSSCLIDADRINSSDFDNYIYKRSKNFFLHDTNWKSLLDRLENKLSNMTSDSEIDRTRLSISDTCACCGNQDGGIFKLSAATGSGKTLSSLRFALKHAMKYKKDHIFIIAPYTSIIDQNADIIKNIFKDKSNCNNIVLEYHSNLVDYNEKTNISFERWDAPIIITTMVQFLEVLYGYGTSKIRKMHQFINSVFIFDEIQTLPLRCTYLFTWGLEVLTKACKSTALLCTATPPVFDELKEESFRLSIDKEIITNQESHFLDFKRVEIVDFTKEELSFSQIAEFSTKQLEFVSSILIVVNTKKQALKMFHEINEKLDKIKVFHLSTNMCPAHRKYTIKKISDFLKTDKRIICVSTSLIEAGVDLDFNCAIRFFSGLDSIAQTAGRCNRNGNLMNERGLKVLGKTFIVKNKNERLGSLEDLKIAQSCMEDVLLDFHENEDKYLNSLLHPDIIKRYFNYYYKSFSPKKFQYQLEKGKNIKGETSILDLLSKNYNAQITFCNQYKKDFKETKFLQSFKSAWKNFEVIENETIGILVPYEKGSDIISEISAIEKSSYEEAKKILKKSQQYSVNIYRSKIANYSKFLAKKEILPGIEIYYCLDGYYDKICGINKEFSGASFQFY